MIKDTNMDY